MLTAFGSVKGVVDCLKKTNTPGIERWGILAEGFQGGKKMSYLINLFLCFFAGAFAGHAFMKRKQRKEISRIQNSLNFWRNRYYREVPVLWEMAKDPKYTGFKI